MRRRSLTRAIALGLLAAVLNGCAAEPATTPTGQPTSSASPVATVETPPTSASPSTSADGERIVVGLFAPAFVPSHFVSMSNAFLIRPPLRADVIIQLLFNGLYRYNESLEAVPDLAAAPCTIASDQVTVTCQLVETTFHDGTPLTAEDVVFTYELASRSPRCGFGFSTCLDMVESVRSIDARTVEFLLRSPDATFFTLVLPNIMIDSRSVIEAAYEPLANRAAALDADRFQEVADNIAAELGSEAPECEPLLADAEGMLSSAGLPLLPRDQFAAPDGTFDACLHAEAMGARLGAVAASLRATGLDAISLAYPALSNNQRPIGTGPFRFVSVEGGSTAHFEASDEYHHGRPAADRFEVRVLRTPDGLRAGVVDGTFDWAPLLPPVYEQVKDAPEIEFASYPDAAYSLLAYNLRPGSLFAEHALRSAVELCIDKPATVDTATNGTGDVIYSPIDPISWAFQPDLRHPQRDVAAARDLIETAGWTAGSDGVYVRDDRRLAADVYVAAGETQRTTFVDLVAEQVRDCGIELNVVRADQFTVLNPLFEYPHVAPGSDKPFEAVFIFFGHGFDPHDPGWSSREVSSPEHPNGYNFMGFANAEVDRLIDEGVATYDQRERARVYRKLQEVLADEQPVLFGWGTRVHEALDPQLRLTDGPINLDSRMWWWQLDKVTLAGD